MQAKLIINGEDFSPWLKENGLQQTEIVRQGRSVVALDGTKYRGEVRKRGISASAKTVRGGHTYFSGGAFTLEER